MVNWDIGLEYVESFAIYEVDKLQGTVTSVQSAITW